MSGFGAGFTVRYHRELKTGTGSCEKQYGEINRTSIEALSKTLMTIFLVCPTAADQWSQGRDFFAQMLSLYFSVNVRATSLSVL